VKVLCKKLLTPNLSLLYRPTTSNPKEIEIDVSSQKTLSKLVDDCHKNVPFLPSHHPLTHDMSGRLSRRRDWRVDWFSILFFASVPPF